MPRPSLLRRAVPLAILTSVLTQPLCAQRGFGFGVGGQLARAADSDRSGDVSKAEWEAFVASLPADKERGIDRNLIKARILLPMLDGDGNGTTLADLNKLFQDRDADKDGALQRAEAGFPGGQAGGRRGGGRGAGRGAGRGGFRRGGFGRRGGGVAAGVLFYVADADKNGEVSAEEWQAFCKTAKVDDKGLIQTAAMVEWLKKFDALGLASVSAMAPDVQLATMQSQLDSDKNGRIDGADLAAIFKNLDQNSDGSLQREELARGGRRGRGQGRGQRGRGQGGRGGFARGRQDRSKPCLVRWQRSLEDALLLVQKTGKPLLICCNMDDEPASETLAWSLYRDPEFARMVNGFIPLIASPNQRNPRDWDDRGRRIPDHRFGRVVNYEHINIEPTLYEKYFNGQRVAPRHLGVSKDGKILFDIYLTQGYREIRDAIQKHSKPDPKDAPAVDVRKLSTNALLTNPDAGHREELERRFAEGDVATRADIAGKALSASRNVQHPEIMRMALRDPAAAVREQAVRAMADNPGQVPLDFFGPALNACHGDAGQITLLLDALQRLGAGSKDDKTKNRIATWRAVFSGYNADSRLFPSSTWNKVVSRAKAVTDTTPAPNVNQLEGLERKLDELDAQRRKTPNDVETNIQLAGTTIQYARIRILQSKDPSFLLQDAANAARKAAGQKGADWRASGYEALATYLLGDTAKAASLASAALADVKPDSKLDVSLMAELLNVLAKSRTKSIYDNSSTGKVSSSWVCDAHSAYELLLQLPNHTAQQELDYLNFLGNTDASWLQAKTVMRAGKLRAENPAKWHEYLRFVVLRDGGAEPLERAYAGLQKGPETEATLLWYAGFAGIVSAERHVQNKLHQNAIGCYERAIQNFKRSIQANADFKDSSNHFICLAESGRARLLADSGQWDAAVMALEKGIAARPVSASVKDGLGNTPKQNASHVYNGLLRAEKSDAARRLQETLGTHGVTVQATAGPRRRGR